MSSLRFDLIKTDFLRNLTSFSLNYRLILGVAMYKIVWH